MSIFGWLVVSFMSAFVFVLIPYVMIGAASGFVLGQARGAMSGVSALWCAVLGPVGWLLTIFLTSDARDKVAATDFAGIADDVRARIPSAIGRESSGSSDQDLIDELGFDPSELD